MMYQATCKLKKAFDQDKRLFTFVEENEEYSVLSVLFPGLGKRIFHIDFVSRDDNNDVRVIIPKIMTVKPEQRRIVLPLLNKFNAEFRLAKFYCDDDGGVNVQYDYFTTEEDPAASAVELHFQLARVARKGAELLAKELKAGRRE